METCHPDYLPELLTASGTKHLLGTSDRNCLQDDKSEVNQAKNATQTAEPACCSGTELLVHPWQNKNLK
jgi:hypothetical protein